MNDPKSTTEVRLIAQAVVEPQARLCESKRDNLEDKIAGNASVAASNVGAITALTQTVNTLVTNVAVLKGRPGMWAAIGAVAGAAVPAMREVALWWFSK